VKDYEEFVRGKAPAVPQVGFTPMEITAPLWEWQRAVVRRAVLIGRMALFVDCGLGKSPMSLEWARQVATHTQGRVLLLTPLAVAAQFEREGQKFGIPCSYARRQEEAQGEIVVSNYERLEEFRPEAFAGVVLDESSILKNYSGTMKQALQDAFARTPYRLACTATPAPNDVLELGNHAEFLGAMSSHEMLARWFINDSMAAGKYRLKGHAEADFWRWVASWAVSLSSPGDLLNERGEAYPAGSHHLPPLHIHQHVVEGPSATGPRDGQLFANVTLNATTLHREIAATLPQRAAKAAALVCAEPEEPWLLWVSTDEEADALRQVLPEAVEVRGSMPAELKAERLEDFGRGRIRYLITKGRIAGFGLNYQHCARMVKMASNFSYEQWYQEVRRSWRFGQQRAVHAHVICASGEERIAERVREKQEAHQRQREQMVAAQRDLQLAEVQGLRALTTAPMGHSRSGRGWKLHLGDCVEVMGRLDANSIGMHLFSPPFSSLYTYSASLFDMGNCRDDEEFFGHYRYLVPHLLRTLKPGRLCVVHCKDLPRYRGASGAVGIKDFPGELVRCMEGVVGAEGERFVYHSKVTIWKSPVTEMHKTKSHGLLYKTLREDASFSRQGLPDYLVVLRKVVPGDDCPEPVTHERSDFPLEQWQEWASPVWMDVDITDVLNVAAARISEDEKHLAPLQLGVIDRCVRLWTNAWDLVCSPFAGIGSEGYGAVRAGRSFVGVELKPEYFERAARNLEQAGAQGDLFSTRSAS
jgi:superfamily II DNA or RNA helicase